MSGIAVTPEASSRHPAGREIALAVCRGTYTEQSVETMVADAIRAAVQAEREGCAKVAEMMEATKGNGPGKLQRRIARAIRGRES